MLDRLRNSLSREARAVLLAAGTLLGVDVASDVTVNEIADYQTARDVAHDSRHAESPPARIERSISTSVKALTMALLLFLSPISMPSRGQNTPQSPGPSVTSSVTGPQREQLGHIERQFEIVLNWPEIERSQLYELASALSDAGGQLSELLERNLPSGLNQAVEIHRIYVAVTQHDRLYGQTSVTIHGVEAANELRETIGKIIYDAAVELLREKCHAIEHAVVESKGQRSIIDATQEVVRMQLLRR